MTIRYQHNATGHYVGEVEDYGGPLPYNSVEAKPEIVPGFIPLWNGDCWQQVETHIGESGFVGGVPVTIHDYGPFPEGWSAVYMDPRTRAEIRMEIIDSELARLDQNALRPACSVLSGRGTEEDEILLAEIEGLKANLRAERKILLAT